MTASGRHLSLLVALSPPSLPVQLPTPCGLAMLVTQDIQAMQLLTLQPNRSWVAGETNNHCPAEADRSLVRGVQDVLGRKAHPASGRILATPNGLLVPFVRCQRSSFARRTDEAHHRILVPSLAGLDRLKLRPPHLGLVEQGLHLRALHRLLDAIEQNLHGCRWRSSGRPNGMPERIADVLD